MITDKEMSDYYKAQCSEAIKKSFPYRLRMLRERGGLKPAHIASLFDMDPISYLNWERGDCIPSAVKIYGLAAYFGVSIDYLLGISEFENPEAEARRIIEMKDRELESYSRTVELIKAVLDEH